MPAHDYAITFVAVVVGLGVADLLQSLHRLIRARRRVRWAALPLLWAGLALLLVINFWWGIFQGATGLQEVTSAGGFVLHLALPIALYLICAAVLPDEVPPAGLDLERVFFSERRYFFSLLLLVLGIISVQVSVIAEGWEPNRLNVLRIAFMLLIAPLLWTESRRYTWLVTLAALAVIVHRLFGQFIG